MSVQVLGGQEVPTELVRHILSFLVAHNTSLWVRTLPAVCRTWRVVSHDLLREHAALLWSRLPPPHPGGSRYEQREKEWDKEPTGPVLYLWRHDDRKSDEDDEYFEEWTYHQLVAISWAKALPPLKQQQQQQQQQSINEHEGDGGDGGDNADGDDDDYGQQDYESYYSSYDQEYQTTAGQVWRRLPWADIFDRFVRRGCSSRTFGAPSAGPVAAVVRLLLLASDASPVVVLNCQGMGGHPYIMTDYEDLKLFITIRPSAEAWLPAGSPPPPSSAILTEQARVDLQGAAPASHIVCVHVRDALRG